MMDLNLIFVCVKHFLIWASKELSHHHSWTLSDYDNKDPKTQNGKTTGQSRRMVQHQIASYCCVTSILGLKGGTELKNHGSKNSRFIGKGSRATETKMSREGRRLGSGIQAEHDIKGQRQGQGARRRYRRYLGSSRDLLICLININWVSTKTRYLVVGICSGSLWKRHRYSKEERWC